MEKLIRLFDPREVEAITIAEDCNPIPLFSEDDGSIL